ncbi:MAG TPA: hypothetical protein VLF94_03415 [Chlamydiales bacterium]|nr:hypothetical protein [Chlamydiales bacterium]
MRRVLTLILFVALMLSLPGLAKRMTQGFRVAKLRLDYPSQPSWEVDPHPQFHEILKQNYTFIGKGAQSYVFESEDGEYVIKLFRYDRVPTNEKVVHLFNACKIAYDHLQEETGLVYIHLNPTPMNLPVLHCRDAVGRNYKFPLDTVRFALQKKAEPFKESFFAARHDPALMHQRIDQFIELLCARAGKEVLNSDPNIDRNFGFLADRAIEFDFGNYRLSPGLDRLAEIHRYAAKLRRWLTVNMPEWVPYLDQRLEKLQ